MSRPDWPGQAAPYREGKIKNTLYSGSAAKRFFRAFFNSDIILALLFLENLFY